MTVGKYQITETEEGLKIEVKAIGEAQEQLLSGFQKCRQGQCNCPTEEYKKLDAMNLNITQETIHIELVAKKSEAFDIVEIARCLDHTTKAQVD